MVPWITYLYSSVWCAVEETRGLSLEEKREKMLRIFYGVARLLPCEIPMLLIIFIECLALKELEKLGPRKGVITQSVKDVVQSLVDDDLVSKDKIGTSLRNVYRKLESDVQSSKRRLTELADQCNALKKGREESVSRSLSNNRQYAPKSEE
ncbi:hypothetical protein NL676_035803 [Syzygium grande]|nr:hypothetical protein NL676_035803 [Syzygium grande]